MYQVRINGLVCEEQAILLDQDNKFIGLVMYECLLDLVSDLEDVGGLGAVVVSPDMGAELVAMLDMEEK